MRDTDTPLCECSGFQKTSKGRGGKVVNFGLCNGIRVPMVRKKELFYKIEK